MERDIVKIMGSIGITSEAGGLEAIFPRVSTDVILKTAIDMLGKGYKEVDSGVFLDKSGAYRFRMTAQDLSRGHVHFETTCGVNGGKYGKNYHVGFRD